MHDDPAAEMRAALNAQAAKTRKRLLAGVLAVVVLAVGGWVGWTLWPTGAKRLAEAAPFIDEAKSQYCRIYETIADAEGADPLSRPPSASLVLPGYHDLEGDHGEPDPRTNTDGIDWVRLAEMCGGQARSTGVGIFYSLLSMLDRVGEPWADRYTVAGVETALSTQRSVEWLVVVVPIRVRDSQVIDHATFEAGELQAEGWLCHLERGCLGKVAVQSRGPLGATSWGPIDAEAAVSLETSRTFRRAVLTALRGAGVRIEDPRS